MYRITRDELKKSLERLVKRYQQIIAGILFFIGIVLRFVASGHTDAAWQIVGELGTFVAVIIAIPFFYERLIKAEDRQLFLAGLEDVLDAKLAALSIRKTTPYFHEDGRLSIAEKVAFIQDAKSEVIEIGTSLRSYVGYFEQRPYSEFRKPVEELLLHGISFKLALMDPECEIAAAYARDRDEDRLVENIKQSITKLTRLRNEFAAAELPGTFDIYTYPHFPYCYMLLVDVNEPNGKALVSHYLFGTTRADAPVLEISKSSNPILFARYSGAMNKLFANGRKL